jgi:hypothetical protein
MTYRGRVRNGVVTLDEAVELPEGVEVEIHVISARATEPGEETIPTLYEQLENVIGTAKGLPADLARNHDHYLHGQPKR